MKLDSFGKFLLYPVIKIPFMKCSCCTVYIITWIVHHKIEKYETKCQSKIWQKYVPCVQFHSYTYAFDHKKFACNTHLFRRIVLSASDHTLHYQNDINQGIEIKKHVPCSFLKNAITVKTEKSPASKVSKYSYHHSHRNPGTDHR